MNDLNVPVVAILRGVEADFFSDLLPAAFEAGLQALEVTMNTPGCLEMIKQNRSAVPPGAYLGAGTICNLAEAKLAVEAGAMFMVTPNLDRQVIEFGKTHSVPVVAGALTPTEVYSAWSAGAAMVKVFPCGAMGGPGYIKDLRGPFAEIPILAVGGVTLDTLPDYFRAGVSGVGVGASFFGRQALAEKNINKLTNNVKNYIQCCLELL